MELRLFFLTEEFIGKNINDSYHFAKKNFTSKTEKQYTAMSWSDVEWLLDNGHSIGAHTRTHPNLNHVQDQFLLKDEIIASADRMEDQLGLELKCFAYPFGSVSSIPKSAITNAMLRFSYSFSNVRGTIAESPRLLTFSAESCTK